jgi:hypothetical protein
MNSELLASIQSVDALLLREKEDRIEENRVNMSKLNKQIENLNKFHDNDLQA